MAFSIYACSARVDARQRQRPRTRNAAASIGRGVVGDVVHVRAAFIVHIADSFLGFVRPVVYQVGR